MYSKSCKNCSNKIIEGKLRKLYCIKNGINNKVPIEMNKWRQVAKYCKSYIYNLT